VNPIGPTPEKSTAFRLSRELLGEVDAICGSEDLTRSQLFRRATLEYLRKLQRERREQDEHGTG
jgi:metal-responsive CopG/Arc/MetJ family transcriptional regulator